MRGVLAGATPLLVKNTGLHTAQASITDALEDRVKDRLDGHISARPQFPFCIYFLVHSSRGAPQSGAPPTARPPHDVRGTVARLWGNNRDECLA